MKVRIESANMVITDCECGRTKPMCSSMTDAEGANYIRVRCRRCGNTLDLKVTTTAPNRCWLHNRDYDKYCPECDAPCTKCGQLVCWDSGSLVMDDDNRPYHDACLYDSDGNEVATRHDR